MSTPNPALVAAAPSLIAVLSAIKQFNADMGPDPLKWALNFPGAQMKLLGTVNLQLPQLAVAEGGALQTLTNNQVDSWISQLQAAVAPSAAAK